MVKINDYPQNNEYVICTVSGVKNYGAFVTLDEYNEKTGFIALPEIATGWIKYVRDHIRENQKIVCKVLRIDRNRGHIDLSKKQVSAHHKAAAIRAWKNEQRAEKLFEMMAENIGKSVEDCYQDFGYQLVQVYGSLYRSMEEYLVDAEEFEENGFSGEWVEEFGKLAKDNISPPYIKITGFIELTCPRIDGMDVIKSALSHAMEDREDVEIQYKGAPIYRVKVRDLDYKDAENTLREVADSAIEYVEENEGTGTFKRTKDG